MEWTVITGACGGLGQALCRAYAKEGNSLLLIGRSKEKLEELQNQLSKDYSIRVVSRVCDLSRRTQVEKLCDEIKSLPIQRLINNAGFGLYASFEHSLLDDLISMNEVNMTSLMMLCHAVIPGMKKTGGEILNVASTAAFQPGPMMSVYYASKAYVLSFSEALWAELKETKVSVSVLCCGPMDTPFSSKAKLKHTWMQKLLMISVDQAAAEAKKGLSKGKRCIVCGNFNRIAVWASKCLPDALILRFMIFFQSRRK